MRKCRVGHGLQFYVERCATCGGVWLDKNEWESLKAQGFHF
ncbi:MAG: zf-TFIIB domain-containing protein [Lentisphaeraceae bacterium]|nr:zf-TFIIB domain-containing protein [Lentisphaeraceae bacterium]